ncbi:hypothetical protein ENSA5_46240 [Enhygromyxa salina]|uniref:LTD domain-containing protein n=1 Tax=Enhygromyxa salina TaxID=215803 RepID=A0A2S9XJ99_9BACT|nr:choice-of-anchor D domain-containing protein [Enhygromyxa salina]PRP92956.1 hypothetical protein ENSA5_46240 [Enhygromyxa salina]
MIKISTIFYDGIIARTEADEFMEIVNDGEQAVDISNWLIDAGPASATNSQKFVFPDKTILQPGQRRRIYTNMDPNNDGSSFGSKTSVWGNKGGTGKLYDAGGQEVDSYTYPLETPDPWVTSTLLPGGDGVHDFGVQVLGSGRQTVVFTLQNRRSDARLVLQGSPVVHVSAGAPAFVVEEQPSSSVDACGEAQFKVSFEAAVVDKLNGELSISIEGLDHPLKVQLAGEGVAKAKLELLHGATAMASGSRYDLGKLNVGADAATSFTLTNSGGAPLNVSTLSLSPGGEIELRELPTLPKRLAAGESVDFEIAFAPTSAGPKPGKLIVSSDAGPDLELNLEGTALATEPNLVLRSGGAIVAYHGSVDMGSATVGGPAVRKTFTIGNNGEAALHIRAVSLQGDGAYSISPSPLTRTLNPGESVDFTVTFEPQSGAVGFAQISIGSDDPDEGNYTFNLSGRAIVPPPPKRPQQLVVKQYYSHSRIFDVVMSNGQRVDFDQNQTGQVSYGYVTLCYYVENGGESNLTVHSATVSNPQGFMLTGDVGTPSGRAPSLPRVIRPGGRLILFLVHRLNTGSNQTTLTLRTDDPNQPSFNVNVTVTGGGGRGGHGGGGGYGGGGGGYGGGGAWYVHTNNHGQGRGMQVANGGTATVPGAGTTYVEVLPPGNSWGQYSWQGVSLIIDGVFAIQHKTSIANMSSPVIFSIACMRPGAMTSARLVYNGATVHSFRIVGQYGL